MSTRLPRVEPETFPPRYRLHKYWGKKPANAVRAYVDAFTRPGGLVLDPFCGSGVTVAEAAIAGRRAIGIDLNPVAVHIARTRLRPVAPERLTPTYEEIRRRLASRTRRLYGTDCGRCGPTTILSTTWVDHQPKFVRTGCGCPRRPATKREVGLARAQRRPPEYPDADIFPGWQMKKLARAGLRRFSELFTPRNLFTVAHLRREILEVTDRRVRDLLMLTFTANLAQCTRMIADYRGSAGGPSWKLNSYWLPKSFQELHPLHYFANRFRKTCAATEEMRSLLPAGADARVFKGDAATVMGRKIQPGSVDFIFTDPPYGGEGIQYGELSMLWNLWLALPQNLRKEIAFNPSQDKDEAFYQAGLRRTFEACRTVLRRGGRMAITFNNRDPVVWASLMSACDEAGFLLEDQTPLTRSAPSVTEKNADGGTKLDMVLLFKRAGGGAAARRASRRR